jgi:hypothetical protein
MFSTLPFSPPSSTWLWIISWDNINAFHFDLPCPRSYHHIPHPFCVDVQHVLHIPLVQLAVDPFDIIACHAFLLFHFWCLSLPPRGGGKGHQETCCLFTLVHGKGLGDIIKGTHNYNINVGVPKIFKNGTKSYSTSINMIELCTGTCSCRGICSNSACIGPQHSCSPISWEHCGPSPSSSISWSWLPPFCQQFSSKNESCFGQNVATLTLGLRPR